MPVGDRDVAGRIWDDGPLTVTARINDAGDVVLTGQDLKWIGGYEYAITVRQPHVPTLVAALGGSPGADPLALLKENAAAIVIKGERTWLEEHDIPLEFWSF